ncbi:hepatoma-derived growth factor-related protein 2-like [Eriocheir sinensis]|uniref:hepatoma-derived growth factor-related protein 2-like n=1 Tax=Eriocheir sinensis TaxID=95602 RepID=UPI0021C8EE5F|nr:hepatoma-derived growth factor-related protein 2-like [Eriocheir sinensis]
MRFRTLPRESHNSTSVQAEENKDRAHFFTKHFRTFSVSSLDMTVKKLSPTSASGSTSSTEEEQAHKEGVPSAWGGDVSCRSEEKQGDDKTRKSPKRPAQTPSTKWRPGPSRGRQDKEVTREPAPDAEHQVKRPPDSKGRQDEKSPRDRHQTPSTNKGRQDEVTKGRHQTRAPSENTDDEDDKTRSHKDRLERPSTKWRPRTARDDRQEITRTGTRRQAPVTSPDSKGTRQSHQETGTIRRHQTPEHQVSVPGRKGRRQDREVPRDGTDTEHQVASPDNKGRQDEEVTKETGTRRREALLSSKAHETLGAGAFGSWLQDPSLPDLLRRRAGITHTLQELARKATPTTTIKGDNVCARQQSKAQKATVIRLGRGRATLDMRQMK